MQLAGVATLMGQKKRAGHLEADVWLDGQKYLAGQVKLTVSQVALEGQLWGVADPKGQ